MFGIWIVRDYGSESIDSYSRQPGFLMEHGKAIAFETRGLAQSEIDFLKAHQAEIDAAWIFDKPHKTEYAIKELN